MADFHDLGYEGEELAVQTLERWGYVVVDRNVRLKRGELDIVARHEGDLVFVEVKTRKSALFGHPAEAITPAKMRKLARAAQDYLYQNLMTDASVRCDVVAITCHNDSHMETEILRDAIPLGEFVG